MLTTQMNIRIEKEVKRVGDKALGDAGLTPTEAVREVWDYAARNRHDARKIRTMFESLREESAESVQDRERQRVAAFEDWLDRGPRLVRETCDQLHIRLDADGAMSADELLGEAYDEEISRLWGEQ